jgi:hypothetical protein
MLEIIGSPELSVDRLARLKLKDLEELIGSDDDE